ncbi:MAG: acyl carrier protein [Bacteroidota bacterium]
MEEKIRLILSEELQIVDELDSTENLLASGVLGSLQMMRLIGYLEEETGWKVPPQDMIIDHFISISSMASYFDGKTVG